MHPAPHLSAASRPVETNDPVTGFATRDQLIEDLDRALDPRSAPSVLAVFDLAGSEDYRRDFGVQASDVLIASLAEECARVGPGNARWYRPRQDEFCALVELPREQAVTLIEDAVWALGQKGSVSLLSVSYGLALLPDEPADAIDALIIADQHLESGKGRERRRQDDAPAFRQG